MRASTFRLARIFIGLSIGQTLVLPQSSQVSTAEERNERLRAIVVQLTAEVNALKIDVLRLQIDAAQARLARAETEWRAAQFEQQRLDEGDRGLNQELQELDAQLLDPTLSAEMREDIAQAKFRAQTDRSQTLQAERNAADRRESIARAQYERARGAHRQLLLQALKLGLTQTE